MPFALMNWPLPSRLSEVVSSRQSGFPILHCRYVFAAHSPADGRLDAKDLCIRATHTRAHQPDYDILRAGMHKLISLDSSADDVIASTTHQGAFWHTET